MKYTVLVFSILLFAACNNKNKNKPVPDSTTTKRDSISTSDSIPSRPVVNNDSLLVELSNGVLYRLKAERYEEFINYIHPVYGVRFSPYGFVDTIRDKTFTRQEFARLVKDQKKIEWGEFDGTGDPINMNWKDYRKRFVYSHDFMMAPQHSVNAVIGGGNSLNNLSKAYQDADFTEFYFPGFEPKYEGMDWKTIRLVFKKEKDGYYLVGIIHDEWTI